MSQDGGDSNMTLQAALGELRLSDVIEMTALGRKTGRLTVYGSDGREAASLSFRDGRVVAASCGPLKAERAFYAVLGLESGAFELDTGAAVDDEDCDLATTTLLLEAMRRIDELARLRRAMPAPARVRLVAGQAEDPVEARVLAYLGPGARTVGDIVEAFLVSADADEYDALLALQRLGERGGVQVMAPLAGDSAQARRKGEPRPKLEP
jgi:hypothetical protein